MRTAIWFIVASDLSEKAGFGEADDYTGLREGFAEVRGCA
jgi:hypothetical protein